MSSLPPNLIHNPQRITMLEQWTVGHAGSVVDCVIMRVGGFDVMREFIATFVEPEVIWTLPEADLMGIIEPLYAPESRPDLVIGQLASRFGGELTEEATAHLARIGEGGFLNDLMMGGSWVNGYLRLPRTLRGRCTTVEQLNSLGSVLSNPTARRFEYGPEHGWIGFDTKLIRDGWRWEESRRAKALPSTPLKDDGVQWWGLDLLRGTLDDFAVDLCSLGRPGVLTRAMRQHRHAERITDLAFAALHATSGGPLDGDDPDVVALRREVRRYRARYRPARDTVSAADDPAKIIGV